MRNIALLVGWTAAGLVSGLVHAEERFPRLPFPYQLHPENDLPYPEGFTMDRRLSGSKRRAGPDPAPVNLPRDIPDRLSACWTPPPVKENELWQVTVRLSFNAFGGVIGVPLTPYLNAPTAQEKIALRQSLLAAIKACTPVRFTPSLGKAIAGVVFAIRYIVHHGAPEQHI